MCPAAWICRLAAVPTGPAWLPGLVTVTAWRLDAIAGPVGPATRPASAAADASTPANRSAVRRLRRRQVKRLMTLPFRQNQPAIRAHGAASLAVTSRCAEPQSLPRQPARRAVPPARITVTRRPQQVPAGASSQPCISSTMTLNQHANPAGTASSIANPRSQRPATDSPGRAVTRAVLADRPALHRSTGQQAAAGAAGLHGDGDLAPGMSLFEITDG